MAVAATVVAADSGSKALDSMVVSAGFDSLLAAALAMVPVGAASQKPSDTSAKSKS